MIARDGGCVPLTDAQRDEAEKYLHLCDRAADRFAKKCRDAIRRDEFLSAAFQGLADAVKGFDESRKVSLDCYAPRRIEGACLDLMREGGHGAIRVTRDGYAAGLVPRVISIDADGRGPYRAATIGDIALPPDPGPPPDAAIAAHEGFESLLSGLGAVERFVIRAMYGPHDWTIKKVSDHLELSPSRIGQIHAAALLKVARRAVRLGLGDTPIVAEPPRRRYRARASLAPRLRRDGVDVALAAAFLLDSIRDGVRPPNWKTAAIAIAAGRPGADAHERAALDDLLARLKPGRREVLALGYGLDGWMRPLKEVARLMGWSPQRVHYAHRMALQELGEMHHEMKRGT